MELTGKIKVNGEAKDVTASFKKRDLVITTEEQYPQDILIEFVQDKCALLDAYKVGENVKVGINIRGREWKSPQGEMKYFNSIQGWRIDKASGATASNTPAPFAPAADFDPSGKDDLPF